MHPCRPDRRGDGPVPVPAGRLRRTRGLGRLGCALVCALAVVALRHRPAHGPGTGAGRPGTAGPAEGQCRARRGTDLLLQGPCCLARGDLGQRGRPAARGPAQPSGSPGASGPWAAQGAPGRRAGASSAPAEHGAVALGRRRVAGDLGQARRRRRRPRAGRADADGPGTPTCRGRAARRARPLSKRLRGAVLRRRRGGSLRPGAGAGGCRRAAVQRGRGAGVRPGGRCGRARRRRDPDPQRWSRWR